MVVSVNSPRPLLRYRVAPSLLRFVTRMLSLPEPSKSPAVTPMPARATPSAEYAAPESKADSRKVPLPLFSQRRFGAPSLATYISGQPSPLKSAQTTPNPGPPAAEIPAD